MNGASLPHAHVWEYSSVFRARRCILRDCGRTEWIVYDDQARGLAHLEVGGEV